MSTATPLGLDPAAVAAALPSANRRFERAVARTRTHLDAGPGYVSWSGGKDSTAVVRMASLIKPDIPVVFFDSGLEFPETLPYMRDLAERWGLNFHRILATPDALTIMRASGAWHDDTTGLDIQHIDMHRALVTEPSAKAHARFGSGNLWGLRAEESADRQALLRPRDGQFTRATGERVCSPIWDWRETTLRAYLARHDVPLNPVYGRLAALGATDRDQRVGLVLDGNNLNHGRARWLRLGWPEMFDRLCDELPRLRAYR